MKKLWIGILAVAVIIAVGAYLSQEDEPIAQTPVDVDEPVVTEEKKVEIFANDTSKFGVEVTSSFTLQLDTAYDEAIIRENLTFNPALAYDLVKQTDLTYEIKPKDQMKANTVYSIHYDLAEYAKAFQTVDDIKIVQSFPGRDAYDVPTKSVIELIFNVDGVEDVEEYFSVVPEIQGSFDYQGDRVVFIPEGLKSGVTYQVTIEPGLTIGNRTMTEAHEFSFTAGYSDQYNWNIAYSVMNVMPESPTVINIRTWDDGGTYNVRVYQAKDFEQYLSTYETFIKNLQAIQVQGYEMIMEEDLQSISHNYQTYVEVPAMASGRYIVEIQGNGVEQYVFLHVDPHQIYYAEATNGSLFWIVDGRNHQPADQAIITSDQKRIGTTGQDGVLFTDQGGEGQYVVTVGEKSYIINNQSQMPYYYYDYYWEDTSNNYWSFIYTDRTAYQPTDRLNAFGFVKAYDGLPADNLSLVLSRYWEDETTMTYPISLDTDLSFTAHFDFSDLDWGYYTLKLMAGEDTLAQREVFIVNYEKPEIQLTSDIEEDIIFAGDTLNYHLNASYFNGLPYENMHVGIRTYSTDNSFSTYTTDSEGNIHVTFKPGDSDDYWYPNYYEIYANNESVEETYLYSQASTLVVPRDTMIQSDYTVTDGVANIQVTTNLIDLTGYNGGFGDNYENIKGAAVDKSIQVTVVDQYYEKIFEATRYDPIHKVTYDVYRYERREERLPSISIETLQGQTSFLLALKDDHYYTLEFTSEDGQGRTLRHTANVGNFLYRWFDYNTRYTMPYDEARYIVGENVHKEVLEYNESIEDTPEDMALHLLSRNGILEYHLTDSAGIDFTFEREHRPNVLLKTIYYDGRTMNIVPEYGSQLIGFDYETLEGHINVTSDSMDYGPGDEVQLNLEVTRHDGSPYNGKLNISVVDEAYFALYEDYFDLGYALHGYVYNDGILVESVSSDDEAMDTMGAEAGEGGDGSYIRDDFKDTAIFETLNIIDGKGRFTFVVPDNLTSWRITLNGVNDALEYASNTANVTVSLPFFVRALYNTEYLTGDEVYAALKSDGDQLGEGDEIAYTVKLMKDGQQVDTHVSTVWTKGLTQVYVGLLDKGTYELQAEGQSGDYKDGIKEVVSVEDTYMYFDHQKDGPLTEGYSLENPQGKTMLTFFNEGARQYMMALNKSYRYDLERMEEIVARFAAYDLMSELFHWEYETYDITYFQHYNGGLRFLSTSDPSLRSTALVAGTKFGMPYFNEEGIIRYLQQALVSGDYGQGDQALILWALAAQEEPVLLLIDEYLKVNDYDELEEESKLYILMALWALNDQTRALDLGMSFFQDTNNLQEDTYVLAAALANHMGLEPLSVNIEGQTSEDTMGLQNLYYMLTLPQDFTGASVRLAVDGQEEVLDLPDLYGQSLNLTSGQNFEVLEIIGDVNVREVFEVSGLDYATYRSPELNLERSYSSDTIQPGDMIEVEYRYEKPARSYAMIHDKIPAGFEYAGPKYKKDQGHISYINNQDIRIATWSEETSGVFTYYIRAVQGGIYHTEPAYIQNFYDGYLYMIDPGVLEVQP